MNTKTTLYLAVVLVLLGSFYVVLRSRPTPDESDVTPASSFAGSVAARDLLQKKLGDVVKVVCKRKGGEEWVFEKDTDTSETGQAAWRMTSPMEMKCLTWEVNKFGSRLGNLQYELSYKPGELGAVTAAEAGLDPPEATVTLTDSDGQTATVEIGKPVSNRETYVRFAGSDDICVGKSDLRDLLKDKPLDYRDKQLWSFQAANVTRVEVVDRSDAKAPVSYTIRKDGSRWMMESPVTARATSKVDDMLRVMSSLRVTEWQDDDASKLAMYGLPAEGGAAQTIRVTVEEEIPAAEEPDEAEDGEAVAIEEESDETPPQKKVMVYELHLSDLSPIGEDTKTYLRIGDEHAVATVMKSTADKFKPVMSEWRDMRITTANVEEATRIEINTREGSATLTKPNRDREGAAGAWRFDPDGGRAEDSVVSDLLKAVGELAAVVFIDDAPKDLASFGLDSPQAEIRLTIPGVEGIERITVGGYTDDKTKRLVYVRRNELVSVAKVRTSDVSMLIQGPRTYRDRTIVDPLPSRFERITLSTENRFVGGRTDVTLERRENDWNMVEPVSAVVRSDEVDKLVEALGGLRAERVIADNGKASAYGLHAPAVIVSLTYKPPVEHRAEITKDDKSDDSDESGDHSDNDKTVPVEVQPPSQTIELSVTEHDGKFYAKRSDRPTIYEVTRDFYKQLIAEYRTDRVVDFDDAQVRQLTIRKGETTHIFDKRDDRWVYQAEPDLLLDSNKVQNLLLQVRDLRTQRYVQHDAADFVQVGLSNPVHEVIVTLEDGTSHILWVSDLDSDNGTDKGFYAAVKGRGDVFLLTADSVKRFEVSLDELEEAR